MDVLNKLIESVKTLEIIIQQNVVSIVCFVQSNDTELIKTNEQIIPITVKVALKNGESIDLLLKNKYKFSMTCFEQCVGLFLSCTPESKLYTEQINLDRDKVTTIKSDPDNPGELVVYSDGKKSFSFSNTDCVQETA